MLNCTSIKSKFDKFIVGLVTSLIVAAFLGGYIVVSEAQSGMANPASVYCTNNGGNDKIVTEKDGDQIGLCVFSNGSLCEEWKYFRGQCTPTDTTPSPLSQVRAGLDPRDIICTSNLQLILKSTDGSPACVKSASATKLLQWGWASKIITSTNTVNQTSDNGATYRSRDVFFMSPNSTAQLDVQYHATWDYPGIVNFTQIQSVYDASNFKTLSNPGLDVTLSPTSIGHKDGQNYIVVYTLKAKPGTHGIYNIGLSCGSDIDVAVGLDSTQIHPQDIPVSGIAEATCVANGFIDVKVVGMHNITVENKPAIIAN